MSDLESLAQVLLSKQCNLEEKLKSITSIDEKKSLVVNYVNSLVKNGPRIEFKLDSGVQWMNANGEVQLTGSLLVIDFFTYCCINCLHILPYLRQLEEAYEHKSGLRVIGVHSGKFDNEKHSSGIRDALSKYNITHPVVNDSSNKIWTQMEIFCWPTVLIVEPASASVVFYLIGENNVKEWLKFYVDIIYDHFQTPVDEVDIGETLKHGNVTLQSPLGYQADKPSLYYPSKISVSPWNESLVCISDTGNNRVIVTDLLSAQVTCIIGGASSVESKSSGHVDGSFQVAKFDSPQGVCWISMDVLLVADTCNHCLRRICLTTKLVTTVQVSTIKLVSPWDICFVEPKTVFVALAGSHQIASLNLLKPEEMIIEEWSDGTCISWKKPSTTISATIFSTCSIFAGNGREENRNNGYPLRAGFAQPSGLAHSKDHKCLFVADSESSTVRRIDLETGQVKNLVGGNIDPLDLFSFGDLDGQGLDVKLQHPLDVAWNNQDPEHVYLADSYNHKIKRIHIESRQCTTITGKGSHSSSVFHSSLNDSCNLDEAAFNEPSGLCVLNDNEILVVDTNNHCIKSINFTTDTVKRFHLHFPQRNKAVAPPNLVHQIPSNSSRRLATQTVSSESELKLFLQFKFKNMREIPTPGAPHSLRVQVLNKGSFFCPSSETMTIDEFSVPHVVTLRPSVRDESHPLVINHSQLDKVDISLSITVFMCDSTSGVCRPQTFQMVQPLDLDPSCQTNEIKVDLNL